jgi:hypothetical protein
MRCDDAHSRFPFFLSFRKNNTNNTNNMPTPAEAIIATLKSMKAKGPGTWTWSMLAQPQAELDALDASASSKRFGVSWTPKFAGSAASDAEVESIDEAYGTMSNPGVKNPRGSGSLMLA